MLDTEYLRDLAPGFDISYVPVIDSTNRALLADTGAGERSVLIAGEQTAGRGRMSRSFASPEGGLYMSVLLRPASAEAALELTPRAAVAVCRAIESCFGRSTEIKWVNDVLIGGRKVCGILAEARASDGLTVVLGIGVNISTVPSGLEETAGAILEAPQERSRERLAGAILNELSGGRGVYSEYVRRCSTPGRVVSVSRGGERFNARALAVDESFRLVVERGGRLERLDSGEVSVK